MSDTGTKTLKTSGKYCEADIIVENTKDGGGGSVEPFTKIITGTITFAEKTAGFQLPETENFLAAYFIRTDYWGVDDAIYDYGAQAICFASAQEFGYFTFEPESMGSTLYKDREGKMDYIRKDTNAPKLSDGEITFNGTTSSNSGFYGTYYYALIYGTK